MHLCLAQTRIFIKESYLKFLNPNNSLLTIVYMSATLRAIALEIVLCFMVCSHAKNQPNQKSSYYTAGLAVTNIIE